MTRGQLRVYLGAAPGDPAADERCSFGAIHEEDNVRRRLLAIALDGLRAHGTEPLPGTTPSAANYEKRWRAAR